MLCAYNTQGDYLGGNGTISAYGEAPTKLLEKKSFSIYKLLKNIHDLCLALYDSC